MGRIGGDRLDEPVSFVLRTRDRWGNFLHKGGVTMSARLVHVKQSIDELSTVLTPQNHIARVDDGLDGSYTVTVELRSCTRHIRWLTLPLQSPLVPTPVEVAPPSLH